MLMIGSRNKICRKWAFTLHLHFCSDTVYKNFAANDSYLSYAKALKTKLNNVNGNCKNCEYNFSMKLITNGCLS